MNLLEIRTRVRVYLKEPTEKFWLDNELNKWINEVQLDIVNLVSELALVKFQAEKYITADGSSEQYELPNDYLRGIGLEDNGGTSYKLIPITQYLKKEEILGLNENAIFSIWNNAIYVWKKGSPPPNGTELHLFYIRKPAELVNDTDETELTSEFHNILINGVLAKAYLKEENPLFETYNNLYVNQINAINGKYSQ